MFPHLDVYVTVCPQKSILCENSHEEPCNIPDQQPVKWSSLFCHPWRYIRSGSSANCQKVGKRIWSLLLFSFLLSSCNVSAARWQVCLGKWRGALRRVRAFWLVDTKWGNCGMWWRRCVLVKCTCSGWVNGESLLNTLSSETIVICGN